MKNKGRSLPIDANLNTFNLGFNKECKIFISIILLTLFNFSFGFEKDSDEIDMYLKLIRDHKFDDVNKLLLNEKEPLKTILKNYLSLKKSSGNTIEGREELIQLDNITDNALQSLAKLNSGLYVLLYDYSEEEKAFKDLKKSLDLSLKIGNKVLACEVLKSILLYYDRLITIKDSYPRFYLELYKANIYDKKEEFIFKILELNARLFTKNNSEITQKEIENLLFLLKQNENKYYKALAFKLIAQYYDLQLRDKDKAIQYHKKGLFEVERIDNGAGKLLKNILNINIASLYFEINQPEKTIKTLRLVKNDTSTKTMTLYTGYKSAWLSKAYKKLSLLDSAFYHHDLKEKIEDKLEQEKHARVVAKENAKYKSEKKDQKINMLSRSLQLLIPISFGLLILGILIFYLYKSYRKKSIILENDQSETLQKLDELKKIVIKNHIILKDKTKVYIADLMYIKSDDHYLNVFLSDGKNHFVRGKLSQIKEELPPNFIQCHRSYIVNSNFIKQVNSASLTLIDKTQIPLSRSYKNKF